ncbi:hypothetical protein EUGRSUZ_F00335 [Eucalyptus grandis]|uniref:Uncharacterized protein n=2 Tax=Eucalyptus grandis TaxID=71139 RepID=A0ACC3KBD6_EUCGR|nr:hypothetical protein EUGRSUZ_F00335 [Eucalyptus grandis]
MGLSWTLYRAPRMSKQISNKKISLHFNLIYVSGPQTNSEMLFCLVGIVINETLIFSNTLPRVSHKVIHYT